MLTGIFNNNSTYEKALNNCLKEFLNCGIENFAFIEILAS